jgi:hypothetical protein
LHNPVPQPKRITSNFFLYNSHNRAGGGGGGGGGGGVGVGSSRCSNYNRYTLRLILIYKTAFQSHGLLKKSYFS